MVEHAKWKMDGWKKYLHKHRRRQGPKPIDRGAERPLSKSLRLHRLLLVFLQKKLQLKTSQNSNGCDKLRRKTKAGLPLLSKASISQLALMKLESILTVSFLRKNLLRDLPLEIKRSKFVEHLKKAIRNRHFSRNCRLRKNPIVQLGCMLVSNNGWH